MATSAAAKHAKRKGSRGEREAVRVLNCIFKESGSTLRARRNPYSGADAHWPGDVAIHRLDGPEVETIEVKRAAAGTITIAKMNGARWRANRRCLMCRHDRGPWVCSVWASVWDELVAKTGDPEPITVTRNGQARGKGLLDVLETQGAWPGGPPLVWDGVVYLTPETFCGLLTAAYGNHDAQANPAETD